MDFFFLHSPIGKIRGCGRYLYQVQVFKLKVTVKKMHYSCPGHILTLENNWKLLRQRLFVSSNYFLILILCHHKKKMVKPLVFIRVNTWVNLGFFFSGGGILHDLGHSTIILCRCAFLNDDIVLILASLSWKKIWLDFFRMSIYVYVKRFQRYLHFTVKIWFGFIDSVLYICFL